MFYNFLRVPLLALAAGHRADHLDQNMKGWVESIKDFASDTRQRAPASDSLPLFLSGKIYVPWLRPLCRLVGRSVVFCLVRVRAREVDLAHDKCMEASRVSKRGI